MLCMYTNSLKITCIRHRAMYVIFRFFYFQKEV